MYILYDTDFVIKKGKRNEIYNISGGYEQKNIDTVKKIIDAFFQEKINTYTDFIDINFVRDGQDVRYAIDDTKLGDLGWSPQRIFDKEISEIVKYYKNNSRW